MGKNRLCRKCHRPVGDQRKLCPDCEKRLEFFANVQVKQEQRKWGLLR